MSDDPKRDDHLLFGDDEPSTDGAGTGSPDETSPHAGSHSGGSYPQPPTFIEPTQWSRSSDPSPAPPEAESPLWDGLPTSYDSQAGYSPPSYQQPVYEQPGYEQPSYEAPSYEPPAYQAPSYEPPAYEAPSYQPPVYDEQSYQPPVYEEQSYDPPSYELPTRPSPSDANPDAATTMRRADLAPQPAPSASPASSAPSVRSGPSHARPAGQQQFIPPVTGAQSRPRPRPEDLLVPNRSDVSAAPASWGWRGRINRASGGLVKSKASPQEVAAREAIVRIQRSFSRPMTVVVVQPKGGAGKTPTTICLSAAFGAHRGGYVVGWDDNETRGTLQVRVRNPDNQQATVWDLLSDLDSFERQDARVGDLSYYVRAQPDAHFDALVSDDNPGNMAQIGDEEFQRLHRVLQRFYRMIVVDTGNNVRSANWQAAVTAADLVVVVSTYQRDVGFSASWVLDHLAQTGREELARNAVTVLTAADPTSDKQVRSELLSHFAQRTRAVVEIPYDPELAHGGPIGWMQLAPATRNAWVEAGATVADALAEQEQRVLQARRG